MPTPNGEDVELNRYNSGGGVKPPNSRSIIPAKAIVVRSCRKPPMICTPIGRPLSLRPIGAAVAGNPVRVAMPAQAS
jgi:hypothetical protein